ncbi:hypothetical protein [Streptoalloteichus hindustanus]|uniref:Uncharacterized protein n=1 Tax=Streptoalloteichus hindustanus TaxID=2017 RepID=A0A1M5F9G7_STRHI|nr:hypothetical protein [Streptoalloteichus hindustanus]SHF87732.1 hypothetical protein SAMN05444320_105317 [Streptoalloteichus hindustanus]
MRDEDILDVAREFRSRLPDELAAEIDLLLARADRGEDVADAVLTALCSDDGLRDEVRQRLDREADNNRGYGDATGYAVLPGYGVPSAEIVYGCAACEYQYPVFEVGEPVPDCPHGHGALVRVAGR